MGTSNPRAVWEVWVARYGATRVIGVAWIVGVAVASLSIRALGRYDFDHTGLLYIGVPYFVALTIMLLRPLQPAEKWWEQYVTHSVWALTIFLASSIVLFEGFICVLFFLPIYYLVVTITFLLHWASISYRKRYGKTYVSVIPLFFLALSLEGTTESLTIDRSNFVSVSATASVSAEQALANLAAPLYLQKERHWILSVFPMPYEIDAHSLEVGDIHTVRVRYHRWFVTNTHEGELQLQILDVEPDRVRTRFVSDSTFFATYVQLVGTEIRLTEIAPGLTEIHLRIDYERKLDPAWYFHPLQQYAMTRMADFLIDEVIIRGQ